MIFTGCPAYQKHVFSIVCFTEMSFSHCLTCVAFPLYKTFKVFPRITNSLTASQQRLESVT